MLMVMQVAGSGGTFPIQCAPEFFRKVYPLLPFVHSMNAMRECIAGFYGMNYWIELGKLALFLIPALLLGLILRKPVIKLNDTFTEKLENTHLIYKESRFLDSPPAAGRSMQHTSYPPQCDHQESFFLL